MAMGWRERYTGTVSTSTDRSVTTIIKKVSSTCWDGLLYDYDQGMYVRIDQSCGTTKTTSGAVNGWTIHESYRVATETRCPALPNIKVQSLYLGRYGGSVSVPLRGSDGNWDNMAFGDCWGTDNGWGFQSPAAGWVNNSWQALTE